MTTQKQIEANRLNSKSSTGPRTQEGKRASSRNALKSGLDAESQFVRGESREEFAQLQAEFYEFQQPSTPFERAHLDNYICNEWYLRRLFRVEAQLWEHRSMQAQRGTGVELAEGYDKNNNSFTRLWRRQRECEKAQLTAQAELERLARLKTQQPVAPEAEPSTSQPEQTEPETPQMASFPQTDQPFAELASIFRQKIAEMGLTDRTADAIDDPDVETDSDCAQNGERSEPPQSPNPQSPVPRYH